ncbi:MAG: hypothetical protein AAGI88_05525 [Pseudomonadota bacterium]
MPLAHPGKLIQPLVLEPSGISQSELSRRLGFNQPQPLNELINGKRGFTPKMSLLFDQVTQGAFPAIFWLTAQALYDVQSARSGIAPGRRAVVDPVAIDQDPDELARFADSEQLLDLTHQLAKLLADRGNQKD